jgi:hypothetical protein
VITDRVRAVLEGTSAEAEPLGRSNEEEKNLAEGKRDELRAALKMLGSQDHLISSPTSPELDSDSDLDSKSYIRLL